ncbi:hypothetical protein Zmor_000313 [Zophobas morio]|uniref:Uncharacterized protein n=1 Tax=Zophobas morio TaxID=2755281 RepID=A0AA38IXA7_9CUCU|nr:hypothetical protein Zmor_000313 [Zophobas morio]
MQNKIVKSKKWWRLKGKVLKDTSSLKHPKNSPESPDYRTEPVGTPPAVPHCVITMLHICSVHGMDIAMTHCSGLPEQGSPGARSLPYLTGHSPELSIIMAVTSDRRPDAIVIDLSYLDNL